MGSDPNSNSSEILWLLSLPARMKKIRLKCRGYRVDKIYISILWELSVAHVFLSYLHKNLMQAIPHHNDVSD